MLYPPSETSFEGLCSYIGKNNPLLVTHRPNRTLPLNPLVYKFGDYVAPSIGRIKIRVPTSNNSFIPITMDVVDVIIPMIIGLDLLDKEELIVENVDDHIVCKIFHWRMHSARKCVHLCLT